MLRKYLVEGYNFSIWNPWSKFMWESYELTKLWSSYLENFKTPTEEFKKL
jgi:hypothetical protein